MRKWLRHTASVGAICGVSAAAALADTPPVPARIQTPITPGHLISAGSGSLVLDSGYTPSTMPVISGAGTLPLGTWFGHYATVDSYAGVDCLGASDSSAGFAIALAANSGSVHVPANCTLLLNSVVLPSTFNISGDGATSVLKHKNSATGHMLVISTAASQGSFQYLTVDGNYPNNGGDDGQSLSSIRLTATGSSATQPLKVSIDHVDFINGGLSDASSFNHDNLTATTEWQETNTRHLGGADGGNAISFNSPMQATFANVLIDPQRQPTGSTHVGRAGIIFFSNRDVTTTITSTNKVTVVNLQCYNTGIMNTSPLTFSGELGCFDSYQAGSHIEVSNSFSKDAVGRGFTWKVDSSYVAMSNIIVSGLSVNTSNPNSAGPGIGLGMNGGAGGILTVGQDFLINGYQFINAASGATALQLRFGNNAGGGSFATAQKARIENVLIDGCGANGILLIDQVNTTVQNSDIYNCSAPLTVQTPNVISPGPLLVQGVNMEGKPNFDATAKTNMWYAPARQGTAFSLADLTVANASNIVQAWTSAIVVNTGSSAQQVNTINGVPDGLEATVLASSATHALTVKNGTGDCKLQSDFVTSSGNETMTVKSINSSLYEIARSPNT